MVDSVSAAGPAPSALAPGQAPHHTTFRTFLSELNPLQYIPVIGTLYRAITGDTIPETARDVGSMVFSGLTGGPIGVAINVASLAVEKATGIDPEKIGQSVLAGIGGAAAHPAAVPASPAGAALASVVTSAAGPGPAFVETPSVSAATVAVGKVETVSVEAGAVAWSPAQLSAYGVTTTSAGDIARGVLQGSDVLNELELRRHQQVETA